MNENRNSILGLTTDKVNEIRKTSGYNEIVEKTDLVFLQFCKKIVSPIPLMIIVALILSVVVRHWEDTLIITLLLIVNLSVDLFQEQKANKALAALKKNLALRALVVRDGEVIELPARELVPGDVIKLTIGAIIPADVVLLHTSELMVDQSAITGESLPVTATEGESLFAGSIVQKGSAYARVTAIGLNTNMGKNIALVGKAQVTKESHFQKAILKIGKFLIVVATILVTITFLLLILQGNSLMDVVRFALVLAIASIPVALPAVLSVTMAIGANSLAKKNTIVSNFRAIEELAGVRYLCVDKTGTLTKNEIAVTKPIVYGQHTEDELFIFAYLALEDGERSPIEQAIHRHVVERGYQTAAQTFTIKKFNPFDPIKKTTEATLEHNGEVISVIMGAPQIIAQLLTDKDDRQNLSVDIERLATDGFRTIAVAIDWPRGVYPVGLIPLMDPPREDSKDVVLSLRERGVTVKMLTGDNVAIARYIGERLNIGGRVITRAQLAAAHNSQSRVESQYIHDADVFAEVIPEDKYNIVTSFQSEGNIVAMTGDGVNDAPALKKADVGIAVSGATDAVRAAADIVLLDSGLSVIREAIDLARKTFARMQSYATFRIAETIRIVFFISLSVLVFDFSPLTAGMIIMLALLNDIPVLAIA